MSATSHTDAASGTAPLAGVKILNFSWIGVGPMGIRALAGWGATVVRVECHRWLDILRLMSPFVGGAVHVDKAPWFAELNMGSYGVSIDLRKPSGLAIAKRLVSWADVVAQSFTPGTMGRWGLDYASVSKDRPDVIYLSTSQMGESGPYSNFSGFGDQAAAMAGFTHLTGWPDRGPLKVGTAYIDPLASRFVPLAVLAALEYRRRTGRGQFLDISQWEAALHVLAPVLMEYTVNGRTMDKNGNASPYAAPHDVFPCQGTDRWCAIAVLDDAQWKAFCSVVGQNWIAESRFSSLLLRKENEEELNARIGAWTVQRAAEDVERLLQQAGVPCHVVSTMADVFHDPQLAHRGFLRKVMHPVMGEHTYRGEAFTLSAAERSWQPGPALGEHNELVFSDWLGMTSDEIAEALIDGGITTDADLPDVQTGL